MPFGLQPEGFVMKPLETIKSEIETQQRADISPRLNTSPQSVIGKQNGIMSTKLRELWELIGAVYNARRSGGASFATLDELCAITGTARAPATKGSVRLQLSVAAGQTVPAGSIARVNGQPSNRWVTTQAAVNSTGGTLSIEVPAEAETAGVFVANAGTITVIATPVSGWLGVNNSHDANPGTAEDTDPQLRVRREVELSQPGTATVEAIRADLLALRLGPSLQCPFTSVVVEENTSAYPDALRRPPHTVEVIIEVAPWMFALPPADLTVAVTAIARQFWLSKPAGIDYTGNDFLPVEHVDSKGVSHRIAMSEPADVDIFVNVVVSVDPAQFGGNDALKDAIAAWAATTLTMGDDVIRSRLSCAIVDVPGVIDVVALTIGRSLLTLRDQNVQIGPREKAKFDTANITVTSS